ncbi:MAG: FkbM family methyltransferase [Shimia sp.]
MRDFWTPYPHVLAISAPGRAALDGAPLIVVDGGAAGRLSEPFASVADVVRAYRFEPRGTDAVEIAAGADDPSRPGEAYVEGGLWSGPGTRRLHVARDPSTSSIYPPDLDYLERFDPRIGRPPRETVATPDVAVTSIDAAVAAGHMPRPDIVKLDIHSAEYEALEGAAAALPGVYAVLVETWHAPVHAGQRLHCDIERRLIDAGFSLAALKPATCWHHWDGTGVNWADRTQRVGSEALFLREDAAPADRIRLALVADLFGYSTLALRLIADPATPVEEARRAALVAALEAGRAARAAAHRGTLPQRAARAAARRLARWGRMPPET